MNGLAADFVQVYQGRDGQTLRESGHLLLKRPGKARWDYSSPERKIFVSDGKNIFFYVYGERYASRAPIKESRDPQIPFLFLLGRSNLRAAFSRIEILTTETPVHPGNLMLSLVPKRGGEDFKQIIAEVNPAAAEANRLIILQRNGSRMDFLLSNVRENQVAPDTSFSFTPPPGVAVKQATSS